MTPIPARIELILYQLDRRPNAVWLSPDGSYSRAQWIPMKLCSCPPTLEMVPLKGHAVERGVFKIEQWKAEELGWLGFAKDERQGELL